MPELITEPFRELLDFYTQHHPDACFGSLDLPALKEAVLALEAAAERIGEAEAALASMREQFNATQAEVLSTAVRAVSFLKIHVEDDSAQVARLDAIRDGLSGRRSKSASSPDGPAPLLSETRRRPRKPRNANASQSSLLKATDPADETPNDDSEVTFSSRAAQGTPNAGMRRDSQAAE